MILDYNKIEIEIQPELAEVVLKEKLGKEFLCWSIIRKIDSLLKGSGKVKKKTMASKLEEITKKSRFTISRYIENGNNIFWRIDNKKEIIYINGFNKVCSILGLEHIYTQNIIYDLDLLNTNFSHVNALLLATVASKTSKPVSNINLSERCNRSKRTIQNYMNIADDINIINRVKNYELVASCKEYCEIENLIKSLIKEKNIPKDSIRMRIYNDYCLLLKQIPNSSINKTGRSSIKKTKRSLRAYLGYPKVERHDKIYIEPDTEMSGLECFGTFIENKEYLSNEGKGDFVSVFIKRGVN